MQEKAIYPYSEWELIEEQFTEEHNFRNETMFMTGNGYIGFRGTLEEGYSGPKGIGEEGTYLNGFYESGAIEYPERLYGYADNNDFMLNVTNSKIIKLFIDGEPFDMLQGQCSGYSRVLSLKNGTLTRKLTWTSPHGKTVSIHIERLTSFTDRHIAAIRYEVTPVNFDGEIKLISALDGSVTNQAGFVSFLVGSEPKRERYLTTERIQASDGAGAILQKTKRSGLALSCAMKNTLETSCPSSCQSSAEDSFLSAAYTVRAARGQSIVLCKYIAYATSRDFAEEQLFDAAKDLAAKAAQAGFARLRNDQIAYLKRFWDRADIVIKGDPALQQGIRVDMFHVLQSSGRDGKSAIGAKGRPPRASAATISGTPRCSSSPSSSTTLRPSPASCWNTSTTRWTRPARARASLPIRRARAIRGGRCPVRNARPTSRRAPRSIMSTPTLRLPSSSTWTRRTTRTSWSITARRSSSRRPASGPT